MLGIFLRLARASGRWGFIWRRVRLHITVMLREESSASFKRAAVLAAPHIPWDKFSNGQHLVRSWAAATSAIQCTPEVGQSVVDALLHIASQDPLRSHIPVDMWSWLTKQPPFPLARWGRFQNTQRDVVRTIRGLGDTKILKSYLLLVWSEWDYFGFPTLHEMCASIQEDFNGIGMDQDREDLLEHLDRVLTRLNLGLEHLREHEPGLNLGDIELMKYEYGELRKVLVEAETEAGVALTRKLFAHVTLFIS